MRYVLLALPALLALALGTAEASAYLDAEGGAWQVNFYSTLQVTASSSTTQAAPDPSIPAWIKTNAGWWAEGQIDDGTFVQAIQYLIRAEIIAVPVSEQGAEQSVGEIPAWIKTNAGWWAEGQIDDGTFVQALQYLIKAGIISV